MLGRADLLRLLAISPRDRLVLDADETGWFGFERQPEVAHATLDIAAGGKESRQQVATPGAHRVPLRMPFAWTVADRRAHLPEADVPTPAETESTTPLDAAALEAKSNRRLVDYEDLVPQARLLPALRRHLGATRRGPIDLERLSRNLAAMHLPRRLPRRSLRRWHPDLVVVLDFSARLWPYREDMHRLAEHLRRQCGQRGVSLRIVEHGPSGPWSDWLAHQDPRLGEIPPEHPWKMPAAGAPVLVVGDLGLLVGPGSPVARAWSRFVDALRQAHTVPMALAPLGAGQLDGDLAQKLPVLRWSPDASSRPERGRGNAQSLPDGLDDLLAMVAAARRVDPPLLRELRKLNLEAPLDAGLEGAVWCHDDIQPGFAVSLRPERQEKHLRRFSNSLGHFHATLDERRRRHHAHLPALLAHEEALLWAAHAPSAAEATPEARARVREALDFMGKLAATLAPPDGVAPIEGDWLEVTRGVLSRTDETMGQLYGPVLSRLVARARVLAGDRAVPGWVSPALLEKELPSVPEIQVWPVLDAKAGALRLQAQPAGDRQLPLGEPLSLGGGGLRVDRPGSRWGRWLSGEALPADLASLDAAGTIVLETARETVTLAALRRPRGAAGWSCDSKGLAVHSPPLAGRELSWRTDALGARRSDAPSGLWLVEADATSPPDRADLRFGIDAAFGVFADLHLATGQGEARQRMRWIEPGTFLMGSPASEPERHDDEGPQHLVTLTRGFWLGATACSQALWRAVTGESPSPSHFKGDDRPVEQVSWNDVQGFLRRLEGLVPGVVADLPTEAEWEYACRAGMTTPFSFGETITPEQVNYDGNYPYAGGAKGLYREETVPVGSLPANAWGLHEMHGNVWEWCADGHRTYGEESVEDPRGSENEGAPRVSRGGSWGANAGWARSACRGAIHPGGAFSHLGFRLSLRSIESGQARPGGPPRASPRDEAKPAPESGILESIRKRLSGRKG